MVKKIIFNKSIIIIVLLVVIIVITNLYQRNTNNDLSTYNRQLSGQLTEQERLLQTANSELNILNSKLLTQEQLYNKLKQDNEYLDKKFKEFVDYHNLQILNREKVIAELKDKLTGTSVVVTDNCENLDGCIIQYNWKDDYNRFELKDPNIFIKNNEEFNRNQKFKLYGEVWAQKDGSLQTKRLIIKEVYKNGDVYLDIPDSTMTIVSSDFEYISQKDEELAWEWTDMFKLRAVAIGSVGLFPRPGDTRFGLGVEFFNFSGVGVNSHTSINFNDIMRTEQRVGVSYSPVFFSIPLNVAIGASVGTPFVNLFNEVSINVDLLFYISN